jgi:Fe(3+) dicitrate transport protein
MVIDPNITDEEGFTADLGVRGRLSNIISYDLSVYGLKYDNRIGEIFQSTSTDYFRLKTNVGDAFIYGVETFADWNIKNTFFEEAKDYRLNLFINAAFTNSEYLRSDQNNIEGNKVEFIPDVNFKTGLNFGYGNLLAGLQYSYLSKQFTDATNAPQNLNDNQRGIEGAVPAYGILDFSTSYSLGRFKLEAGINNLLNNSYFTRRATGYPGPGIIPAQPVTWYTTLEIKL